MAGEIQLNSTTFATESGGTVTVSNVDSATNRTNLGLGSMATQAANSVSISGGNITGGTIGSGVVFPSGVLIDFDLTLDTATVTKTTSSDHDTPVIAGGTQISITVPDGCTAIMTAAGGKAYGSSGTTRYNSICTIVYSTSGSDVTTSDTQIIGGEVFAVSPPSSEVAPGYVSGSYTNSTGSSVTLKWKWAVKGVNSSSYVGQWNTTSGKSAVALQTLIFRT